MSWPPNDSLRGEDICVLPPIDFSGSLRIRFVYAYQVFSPRTAKRMLHDIKRDGTSEEKAKANELLKILKF